MSDVQTITRAVTRTGPSETAKEMYRAAVTGMVAAGLASVGTLALLAEAIPGAR